MPQKRNPENDALPTAWRYRKGFYFYRVPPNGRKAWYGKSEVVLGRTIAEGWEKLKSRALGGSVPDVDKKRVHQAIHKAPPKIPSKLSGVYFLFQGDELVYIGQAVNVLTRIDGHDRKGGFDSWTYIEVRDPEKRYELEQWAIYTYNPPLNWTPL